MAGIDPTGFVPKPLQTIKSDLETGFRAVFGAAITLIAQSIFGQLIGILADRYADLWQLGLALYNASTREGATGVQLDNIGALTGSTRKQATYTKVTCTCAGVNPTTVLAGQLISIPGVGTQFTNDLPFTITAAPASVVFRAVLSGPKTAFAGTVTHIDTPVAGWSTVTNPLDHSALGTDIESDAVYRMRQVQELRAQGASTVASIRAQVELVSGVTGVFVFENTGDVTNVDGLPPHSFEVVVSGGLDADIAKVIATYKPAGIATYGSTTVATTDANGFTLNVKFSRASVLNVYIVITQTADIGTYPNDGDAQVKAAIVALQPYYGIGRELRSSQLVPAYVPDPLLATSTGIVGVLESALPLIGTAPAPVTSTTLVAGNRQIFSLDTSRITVTTTLIVP